MHAMKNKTINFRNIINNEK